MGTQVARGQQQGPHSVLEEAHLPARVPAPTRSHVSCSSESKERPPGPAPLGAPWVPRGELGATPPPPFAHGRTRTTLRGCSRTAVPITAAGRSDPGPRAAPSPAPAPVSPGRSSRLLRTAHSTGCSAPSWCGRETQVPRACRGWRPKGQGRGDRPGWAPAARASQRRDYLIAWSGEERGGGAGRPHPPASWVGRGARRGRGGHHCSSLQHHPIPLCGFPRTCQEGCYPGQQGGWGPRGGRWGSCFSPLLYPSGSCRPRASGDSEFNSI